MGMTAKYERIIMERLLDIMLKVLLRRVIYRGHSKVILSIYL